MVLKHNLVPKQSNRRYSLFNSPFSFLLSDSNLSSLLFSLLSQTSSLSNLHYNHAETSSSRPTATDQRLIWVYRYCIWGLSWGKFGCNVWFDIFLITGGGFLFVGLANDGFRFEKRWLLLNFLVFLGWGLWSLSCLGVVYFLCTWTVVCGYEFKPDLSLKGKRSSRDDDTDLVVGPSHGVDDDGFGFIGDGETRAKKQKENK